MRRTFAIILSVILVFGALPAYTPAEAAVDYNTVRVKLTTNNATSLTMSLTGDYFIEENGVSLSGGTLTVRALGTVLTVTHSTLGDVYSGSSFSLMREKIDRNAGYVKLNSSNYLGHFKLKVTSSGYIQVVNIVPLAHYLYGVVGYEMSNTFPIEALKAQAIAAKGYVLSMLGQYSDYDIGDTSSDQVYKGYNSSYTSVISAVDSTINEVLAVNGSILCTFYAASNGGETNLPTYAWPSKSLANTGYSVTLDNADVRNIYSPVEVVKLPVNIDGTLSSALYSFLLTKVSNALGYTVNTLYSISSVYTYGEAYSGTTRNQTRCSMGLVAYDSWGSPVNVSIDFALSELYSYGVVTNSSLRIYWGETVGNYYYIYHLRYGHGVGLSQRGAQQMATEGSTYRQILGFYYPGATLSTITVTLPSDPINSNTLPTGDYVLATTTGNVNFRKQASTSSTILAVLDKGVTVQVYSRANGWAYAVYNNMAGYISEDYLEYAGTPPGPGNGTGDVPDVGVDLIIAYGQVTQDGVNYRNGPGTAYASYGKLSSGMSVMIFGEQNGWYKLLVNNTLAYVSKEYIKITGYPVSNLETEQSGSMEVQTPGIMAYGELTSSNVNFRVGPSTSYAVIQKLSKGTEITIYSATGNWYYGSIDGKYGYVSKDYIKITSQAQSQSGGTALTPSITDYSTVHVAMITGGGVNFRTGPSTASTSMRKLEKNTALYVLSETGDWYYVLIGSQYGYVYKTYVSITGTAQIDASGKAVGESLPSGVVGKGVTTGGVNYRSGPSVDNTKIGTFAKGTALYIYNTVNGWYYVTTEDASLSGYVSSAYVKVTASYGNLGSTESTQSGSSGSTILGSGKTTAKVNFREGPSTSAKKITQLTSGVAVTIYSLNNGWYEVDYQGTRGYLYAKYVQVVSLSSENTTVGAAAATPTPSTGSTSTDAEVTLATGKTTGQVNFRTRPSTTSSAVIKLLPKSQSLSILGQCGDWYYVLIDGATGYVSKSYVSIVSSGSVGINTVSPTASPTKASTTAQANMRVGPGTSYGVIKLLDRNTEITVYLEINGWCLVKVDGVWGFVTRDYVK